MSHYYKAQKISEIIKEVETPAQARKHGHAWPSVTTVLGIIKDPFLDDQYMPSKMAELKGKYPDLDWRELKDLCYGERTHPWIGNTISSSEFGTAVHNRIEELLKPKPDSSATPWDDWAKPFVDWVLENKVEVMGTEYVVSCDKLKIAGSVDFIGKDKEGQIFLADYKTRKCKGSGKFYAKDCEQLAVEASMLKDLLRLDYMPKCLSVCICTDSTEHYHKTWKDHETRYAVLCAEAAAKVYWLKRMTKATDFKVKL